jgi:hypothetical protein
MAGMNDVVEAKTMTELKRKVQQSCREMREMGLEVHHTWDPASVQKAEDGTLRFWVHAHT